jgi:membrane protein required for colicin V production
VNTLDVIVLGIVAISGLFAFAKGFVRAALSIGTWLAAGFVAVYGFPLALPFASKLIANPTAAQVATGMALFIVPLVILTLVTGAIANRVKGSSLSALDRTLGFVFGLVRGAVLVSAAYLAASAALPEKEWPDWAQRARTRPLLASGAEALRTFIPGSVRDRTAAESRRLQERAKDEIADRAIKALVEPRPPAGKSSAGPQPGGYNQGERRDMDRLFQSTQ